MDGPTDSLAEIKASGRRWGLEEFVEVVNGLVERYLPVSRSANVKLRDAFNPRLVRYYGTFGLISPAEREGKAARYTYRHLLQALVIRRLLFEGFTAPALLKMLAGKGEADYEATLAGSLAVGAAVAREKPETVPAVPAPPMIWRRVEVAPGLEVHLRADFVPPDAGARREALLRTLSEIVAPLDDLPLEGQSAVHPLA